MTVTRWHPFIGCTSSNFFLYAKTFLQTRKANFQEWRGFYCCCLLLFLMYGQGMWWFCRLPKLLTGSKCCEFLQIHIFADWLNKVSFVLLCILPMKSHLLKGSAVSLWTSVLYTWKCTGYVSTNCSLICYTSSKGLQWGSRSTSAVTLDIQYQGWLRFKRYHKWIKYNTQHRISVKWITSILQVPVPPSSETLQAAARLQWIHSSLPPCCQHHVDTCTITYM